MSMVHRNWFQYIQIHPTLMMFVFISIMTGTFVQLFIILCLVTIHELGHFFAARYFNWRTEAIVLWAFGGVMKTDEYASRPLKEELIVTLCGPAQHGIIFIIAYLLQLTGWVPPTLMTDIFYFNAIILLFNVLPIYPLDGGKVLQIGLSFILPYRQAYRSTLILSGVVAISMLLLQLLFLPFTLTAALLIIFLILELVKYYRNEYYTFLRFLLHRLHHPTEKRAFTTIYATPQDRLIDVFNHFKRNKTNRIYLTSQKFFTEQQVLHLYFYEKRYTDTFETIGQD